MKPLTRAVLFLLLFVSGIQFGFAQKNHFIATYTSNGKEVHDTFTIKDTALAYQMQQMMTNPNYKLPAVKNDTTFNKQGKPVLVKYQDTIFGASVQILEYDSIGRLVRLTGY